MRPEAVTAGCMAVLTGLLACSSGPVAAAPGDAPAPPPATTPGADLPHAAAPVTALPDPDGWPAIYTLVERWDTARLTADTATLAATSAPGLRAWGATVDPAALPAALRTAPALAGPSREGHAPAGGSDDTRRVQVTDERGPRWVDLVRTPAGWRVAAWDEESSLQARARTAPTLELPEGATCWQVARRYDAAGSGMAWDEVVSEAILRLDHEGRRIRGSYSYRGGFSHLVTEQVVLGGAVLNGGELRVELGPPTFPTSEEPAPRRVDERWRVRLLPAEGALPERLLWLDGAAPFPGVPMPRVPCP